MKDTDPEDDVGLTDKELEEIKARCDAATPGPWRAFLEGRDHESGSDFIMTGEGAARGEDIEMSGASPADYEFIAHARQDVPRLVAEILRIRKLLQERMAKHEDDGNSRAR